MFEHIKIYHLMKLRYQHSYIKEHFHDFYQMIYVIKGEGEIRIFDKNYICKAKDIIFIRRNEPHSITAEDMMTFEIKFSNENDSLNQLFHASSCFIKDSEDFIKFSIQSIDNEIENNRLYRDDFIKLEFYKILLSYLRYFNVSYQENKNVKKPPIELAKNNKFLNMIQYIDENYKKKITVKELSQVAHVEYKYFSKVFSKQYGIGPKQYLTYVRLEKVKELLINSDLTISEIAEQTGFERIHNLDITFFQNEGMSPGEFRENVAKMYKLNMQYNPAKLTFPVMK